MKVLVTGATGFIGKEIVAEFLGRNFQVIGIGKSKNSEWTSSEFTFIKADITVYGNLSNLEKMQNVEAIVHSAGLAHQFGDTQKEQFEAVNIRGTENILKLAVKLGVKHFILIGSTAIYGICTDEQNSKKDPLTINEDKSANPQTLYAESKLEGEKICRRICEANGIALTIFRLAPVIGEGSDGNVSRLISAIDKNRFIWIGNGSNLKTLIYKGDVARACAELVEKKQDKTEIFNLAAEPIKMKEFVEEIASRLNKKIIPIKIPAGLLRKVFQFNSKTLKLKRISKISETIEKWLSDDIYDAGKIAAAYNFKTQTSIAEALAKQIGHYKKHGK